MRIVVVTRNRSNRSQIDRRFFGSCDLENCRMTSKTIRAPLICHFKLCSPFRNHLWIQSGFTVRNQNRVKTIHFAARAILKFGEWHWKTLLCHFKLGALFRCNLWIRTVVTIRKLSTRLNIYHSARRTIQNFFYATSSIQVKNIYGPCKIAYCFIAYQSVYPNWSCGPKMPKLGPDLFSTLWPRPLTIDLDLCRGVTVVSGNYP